MTFQKSKRIPWNKDKKGLQVAWNKNIPCREETKQKLRLANSGINNHNYGKPRSKEIIQKIRLANIGKKRSAEFGLKMGIQNSYSKEEIIDKVKSLVIDGTITKNKIRNSGCIHNTTIINHFGSYENFEKESGIKIVSGYPKKWDKQKIIKFIRDYIAINGYITVKELYDLCNTNKLCNTERIRHYFGSFKKLEEEVGIPFIRENQRWTKEKVQQKAKLMFLKHKKVSKSYFDILSRRKEICDRATVRQFFNSLEDLAISIGEEFYKPIGLSHFGKNENHILDKIELNNNIKLERQFRVDVDNKRYFIDGYDKDNNIIYEVDEVYHRYKSIEDQIRENAIKEKLNCQVIRIDEKDFLRGENNGCKHFDWSKSSQKLGA